MTGLSLLGADIAGKRLSFLTEIVPGLDHVAVVHKPDNPASLPTIASIRRAGEALGIRITVIPAYATDDFDTVFARIAAEGGHAAQLLAENTYTSNAGRIAPQALRQGMPIMYDFREMTLAGGLISYGVNLTAHYERAAFHVTRILEGTRPGDLPIEQPMVFDLAVNLKTANQLYLTVPPEILTFATEIIE